jgi:hypothetical protein
MSWYVTATLLSYSILPATIIALIKYRQCRETYLPLLFLLVGSTLNEIMSTLIIRQGMNNSINCNIYILAECWILLWLFMKWEPELKKKRIYPITATILSLIWVADHLLLNRIDQFNAIYRIAYSFSIVFISVNHLGYVLINEKKIVYNTRFILCIAFFIQYCYKTFIEILVASDPGFSREFYQYFFMIWLIVNTLTNISYVFAVLWIPRKERYYITYC